MVLLYFSSHVIETAFAIPKGEFIERFGQVPSNLSECEAISLPSRRGNVAHCSTFGSIQTNPIAFFGLSVGLVITIWLLFLTTRPGRGLRFSNRPAGE